MKKLLTLCCILLINITTNQAKGQSNKQKELTIAYPKDNQKVRGIYKIYGGSQPNSIVKLTINSTYYKTNNNNGTKITKGEGPLKKMNRTYSIKSDRNGTWKLENIDLTNRGGYEETFIIKANDDKETKTIMVYDKTRPVLID